MFDSILIAPFNMFGSELIAPFYMFDIVLITPFCSANLKVDTYKLKSIHSKVEMYTDVSNT